MLLPHIKGRLECEHFDRFITTLTLEQSWVRTVTNTYVTPSIKNSATIKRNTHLRTDWSANMSTNMSSSAFMTKVALLQYLNIKCNSLWTLMSVCWLAGWSVDWLVCQSVCYNQTRQGRYTLMLLSKHLFSQWLFKCIFKHQATSTDYCVRLPCLSVRYVQGVH